MATSTKTKQATKRAPRKQTAKKSPAKKTGTKSATKRAPAKTQPKRTVRRSTMSVSDRDRKTATKATAMMRENVRGDGKRAPVNATQVALVRSVVGRKSVATVAKTVGFASKTQLAKHASGSLETMPDGASAKLTEFARALGDGPGASKIRGRKLTAILATL